MPKVINVTAPDGDGIVTSGQSLDDTIYAGAGAQTVYGNAGNDTLNGNAGDDVVNGDEGNDLITGGDGADQLWGNDGNDTMYGNAGNDTMVGGVGSDLMYGGTGDDLIFGNEGNDTVYGGFGNDAIYGGDGNDVLVGGDIKSVIHSVRKVLPSDGDDLVFGGPGNDWTDGGNGNNLLNSGPGLSETMIAGNGNDIALANTSRAAAARFVIDLDGGHNLVIHTDFNKEPEIPFEVCERVTFGPPIIPVIHGHILQPGKVPGVPETSLNTATKAPKKATTARPLTANLARALAQRGPTATRPAVATGPGAIWNQLAARKLVIRAN